MPNAVIGANGFIGSRVKWYANNFTNEECIGITKDSWEYYSRRPFKYLIWAAGSARKDLGHDKLMKLNYRDVRDALAYFNFEKFIYVSSQAVYPEKARVPDEDLDITSLEYYTLSDYGRSKIKGEWAVQDACSAYGKDYLIIRPNGFVGPGLKKNVIHSLAKDPPESYYTLDSKFQVIHTDIFAAVIFMLAGSLSREIINVTSPGVVTPVEIANYMGVDIKRIQQPKDRVPPRVEAVFSTAKLESFLKQNCVQLPTTEEAIRKWDEPFEVRMPELRKPVGGSTS